MDRRRKKKKLSKLKWFLFSASIVILVIVGYLVYEFKFKTYEVADNQVAAIIDDGFLLNFPDGTIVQLGADGKVLNEMVSGQFKIENEDTYVLIENNRITKVMDANGGEIEHTTIRPNLTVEKQDEDIDVVTENGDKVTLIPGQPEKVPTEQKPTVASIKQKYTPLFQNLQSQAESKVSSLIGRAQAEYSSKKMNGESVSFGYFYNKYMGAASGLEASTDAAFENLLAAVEQDLENNGFNKSYAASFRNEYSASKEALRSELYKKALNMK